MFPGWKSWVSGTTDQQQLHTSSLLHKLENNYIESEDMFKSPYTSSVVDGNALLHCLSGNYCTFGYIAKHVFHCLPQTASTLFGTVAYTSEKISIKSCEDMRRESSNKYNHLLQGPATKVPTNWRNSCRVKKTKRHMRFLLS